MLMRSWTWLTGNIQMQEKLIKWVGANSYRTSHYPYADEIMDMADRWISICRRNYWSNEWVPILTGPPTTLMLMRSWTWLTGEYPNPGETDHVSGPILTGFPTTLMLMRSWIWLTGNIQIQEKMIKWVGANSYRTSHYPYADEIRDMANRWASIE
jgi:hypothetical protein